MTFNLCPETCNVALLSRNMLEVTDLTEFFEDRRAGTVTSFDSPEQVVKLLGSGRLRPSLAVFGFSLDDDHAQTCWQSLRQLGLPIILLDGEAEESGMKAGVWSLSRPYTTAELEFAVAQTGFPCAPA